VLVVALQVAKLKIAIFREYIARLSIQIFPNFDDQKVQVELDFFHPKLSLKARKV